MHVKLKLNQIKGNEYKTDLKAAHKMKWKKPATHVKFTAQLHGKEKASRTRDRSILIVHPYLCGSVRKTTWKGFFSDLLNYELASSV